MKVVTLVAQEKEGCNACNTPSSLAKCFRSTRSLNVIRGAEWTENTWLA